MGRGPRWKGSPKTLANHGLPLLIKDMAHRGAWRRFVVAEAVEPVAMENGGGRGLAAADDDTSGAELGEGEAVEMGTINEIVLFFDVVEVAPILPFGALGIDAFDEDPVRFCGELVRVDLAEVGSEGIVLELPLGISTEGRGMSFWDHNLGNKELADRGREGCLRLAGEAGGVGKGEHGVDWNLVESGGVDGDG
ncbi:hypothetical protein T439DRAFT_223084 [Meredithblackwellia eburnea MCA 4105]